MKLFGYDSQDPKSQKNLHDDVLDELTPTPVEYDDEFGENEEVGQISLDVYESKDALYILAPIAGIELHDIDISIDENTLIISGVRNLPLEFDDPKLKCLTDECFWGNFKRSIILPENLDFSAIKAIMENNLLVISIPKLRFSSKSIKINKIYS